MTLPLALIIEDDPKLAELYETVLQQCKYETRWISSGKEALGALKTTSPSLILLDIHLPYVSGTEIISHIQSNETLKKIPLVIITADLYKARDLSGQEENIILKTHGVTKLQEIAKRVYPDP